MGAETVPGFPRGLQKSVAHRTRYDAQSGTVTGASARSPENSILASSSSCSLLWKRLFCGESVTAKEVNAASQSVQIRQDWFGHARSYLSATQVIKRLHLKVNLLIAFRRNSPEKAGSRGLVLVLTLSLVLSWMFSCSLLLICGASLLGKKAD